MNNYPAKYLFPLCIVLLLLLVGCSSKEEKKLTPWGTVMGEEETEDTTAAFTLDDIISNGEMIMLTMSGPETYYDYHGHGMGLQYMLCERFAREIGVTLRVELCTDTMEMVNRLKKGDADIIVYPLPKQIEKANGLLSCGAGDEKAGVQWAVLPENKSLADTLNRWYKPEMVAQVKQRENYIFSSQSITRRVYAPVLDGNGGVISSYDSYFKRYSGVVGIDWRLMAAQCYQESCFDPRAKSWAGACGLMQIMPSTGSRLGISGDQLFQPEPNISAAARYMAMLSNDFKDVSNREERLNFVLASYNGGSGHVRDAMALARKHGGNPQRWSDVSHYMLLLMDSRYYSDPVVKHGYMRSTETVDYVNSIRRRYDQYRGVAAGAGSFGIGGGSAASTPQPATKKHRYRL